MTLNRIDFEQEIIAEVIAEIDCYDPVVIRFKNIYFVSKSKGRNRSRPRPQEVHLILDRNKGRCISFHLFAFDDASTEVHPGLPGLEAEDKLRKRFEK